jgi:hypothetical protein
VPDLDRAIDSFGLLLESLGYTLFQTWSTGRSWRLGTTYLVFEQSPALTAHDHDRCRPGLNHLAFHIVGNDTAEALVSESHQHGWTLMFPGQHPNAIRGQSYTAYLENTEGFQIELVAPNPSGTT